MKRCHCQNNMKKSKVPVHVGCNEDHTLLKNIPTLICTQCGELYFKETDVKKIQQAIRNLDKLSKKIGYTGIKIRDIKRMKDEGRL